MLSFYGNPLMNEDPLAKLDEILALNVWYKILCLMGSNLPGILGMVAFIFVGNSIFGTALAVATIYSLWYHACQTMGVCFRMNLALTTMLDHMTAPSMAGMVIVFSATLVTAKRLIKQHQALERKMREGRKEREKGNPLTVTRGLSAAVNNDTALLDGDDDWTAPLGHIEAEKEAQEPVREEDVAYQSYYYKHLYREENTVRDTFTAVVVYVYLFVTVTVTLAHPFSMQSFLVVIAFGLGVVFFKIVVLDDGHVVYDRETVSVPDVAIGVTLVAISLVFFVLDTWFYYWIFHSLWHIFSFTGVYFYGMGLSKGLPDFYSPYEAIRTRLKRYRRRLFKRKREAPDVEMSPIRSSER